jgi:hypothetical protein
LKENPLTDEIRRIIQQERENQIAARRELLKEFSDSE